MVLYSTRSFRARYHTVSATDSNTSILMKTEPDTTHIPVRKRATIPAMMFFGFATVFIDSFTAVINNSAMRTTWNIIPVLCGSLRVLTKKRSKRLDILTNPGISPQIRSASRTNDSIRHRIKLFQENSCFLK